jgi:hypothetical protein
VVMFGEGYRARRHCKDRRKGDRTNLHRFLLINVEMASVLSRGNEQARCRFRLLQPLKPCAFRPSAMPYSLIFCGVLMK